MSSPEIPRRIPGNYHCVLPLIKDTTREEREQIVHQALWGSCGIDCEFCSGCDNRGGGRIESIYQPYIDGLKELREINAEYNAPFVR